MGMERTMMDLEECEQYLLDDGQTCATCGYIEAVTVACDDRCNALLEPSTLSQARATIQHSDSTT
jgi:methionyl-tRNA synthetase